MGWLSESAGINRQGVEDARAPAIHTVKADDIATFLGKKLTGHYQGEMGNRYNIRLEGTRVRHAMGMSTIKMYDKFACILAAPNLPVGILDSQNCCEGSALRSRSSGIGNQGLTLPKKICFG